MAAATAKKLLVAGAVVHVILLHLTPAKIGRDHRPGLSTSNLNLVVSMASILTVM
jgi:hypothetical protein